MGLGRTREHLPAVLARIVEADSSTGRMSLASKRNLLLPVFLFCIWGCCTMLPSDRALHIEGVARDGPGCDIRLLLDGREIDQPQAVRGAFHRAFFVSFCHLDYTIQARCDGQVVLERSAIGGAPGAAVDLGRLSP